jgi:branched-chain amino acid transport system substrate-binding protein
MKRKLTRRDFLGYSSLTLAAMAGSGPFIRTARAAQPKFKAGVITSLSGENMFGGNLTRRGYDLWAETVNKKGGVSVGGERYPVQMFYGDAQSKPSSGADAAERLISQDEVDLLFGPYTSGVTLAVQPICAKYRVPMISGSAESPNVWKAKPEFNFGMIPSVDLSAGKSLGVLAGMTGPKSVAVVGANEPFSKETAEGFEQGVKDLGLDLVSYDLVPPQADLTPVVSKIASENPDVVAVGAHEEILINFIKASKSLNFRPKAVLMHYGVTAPAFAQQLGKDADGVCGIAVWTPDVPFKDAFFGTAKDYDQLSYNRWGSHPDYTEAACSASGLVFADAAARLGKAPPLGQDDRMALTDALAATDISTFYGPVKFEREGPHYHDNTKPIPVLIQIQNGQVVPVGPKTAARAQIIYPLPSWS